VEEGIVTRGRIYWADGYALPLFFGSYLYVFELKYFITNFKHVILVFNNRKLGNLKWVTE
jgi:hypothetical protein